MYYRKRSGKFPRYYRDRYPESWLYIIFLKERGKEGISSNIGKFPPHRIENMENLGCNNFSKQKGGRERKEIIRTRGNDINARKDRKRWIGCYWIIARIIKMEIRVENSFHSAIVGNIGKYFLERKLSGLARTK